VISLPVAYHCIFRVGLPGRRGPRRAALARRVRVYRLRGKGADREDEALPGLGVPTAGGLLFTALITIWYTSALWFFTTIDSGI
jgi:hypothetical protein